jgi:DNA-binding Lrp family transcriptional regulator
MVTAVVLINVERPKLKCVTSAVLEIEGVTEVYAVAGEYDLVAILKVSDSSKLSEILVDKMPHHIDGITHTKTLFGLEVYTK